MGSGLLDECGIADPDALANRCRAPCVARPVQHLVELAPSSTRSTRGAAPWVAARPVPGGAAGRGRRPLDPIADAAGQGRRWAALPRAWLPTPGQQVVRKRTREEPDGPKVNVSP